MALRVRQTWIGEGRSLLAAGLSRHQLTTTTDKAGGIVLGFIVFGVVLKVGVAIEGVENSNGPLYPFLELLASIGTNNGMGHHTPA